MLTVEILQAGAGASLGRAVVWLPLLQRACDAFDISTADRLAAFLAQVGHESARLVHVREIWGPTAVQQRYEGRKDLGNVRPGDGRRFMGRGLIQTTGRTNYAATRDGLRLTLPDVPDFESAPEQLEQPLWAAMSAGWYWQSRGLNALADAGDFFRITRRINGGTNGMEDRLALHERARAALGVVA